MSCPTHRPRAKVGEVGIRRKCALVVLVRDPECARASRHRAAAPPSWVCPTGVDPRAARRVEDDGDVMSWNRFLVQAVLVGTTAAASAAWVEPAAAAEDTAAEGAAAGPKRVVIALTGPQSKKVRGYLVKELDGDVVNVVPEKEAKKIGPKTDKEKLVAFATENNVSAFVLGRVILKKGVAWILEVEILNGADGAQLEELSLKGPSVPGLGKKISSD